MQGFFIGKEENMSNIESKQSYGEVPFDYRAIHLEERAMVELGNIPFLALREFGGENDYVEGIYAIPYGDQTLSYEKRMTTDRGGRGVIIHTLNRVHNVNPDASQRIIIEGEIIVAYEGFGDGMDRYKAPDIVSQFANDIQRGARAQAVVQ